MKRRTKISSDLTHEFQQLIQKLRPQKWGWSSQMAKEVPLEINIENDGNVAILHPNYSIGTAAVFGEMPLNSMTTAYWEIYMPAIYGTSIMFGIGLKEAKPYSLFHFEPLLGHSMRGIDGMLNNIESIGLSHLGVLYGAGRPRRFCNEMVDRPTTVGVLFNGPDGWLAYFIDGQPLGIAFTNINASVCNYYPMISSTAQRSVFEVRNQLCLVRPMLLRDICLRTIVKQLSKGDDSKVTENVKRLELPSSLSTRILSQLRPNKRLQSSEYSQPNSPNINLERCKLNNELGSSSDDEDSLLTDEEWSGSRSKRNRLYNTNYFY